MSAQKTRWVVSFRRFHKCVTSFTFRELVIVWNKNFIRTECRIPLRFCFSSCVLNSKSSLGFFVRTTRMFALKKKLSWCWLVRLLSASCFVVSNCEREGYCSNKKNLRTLSLSEKIQLWYAYTLLLRKHVVIDSYNRFSWQLWFLLKTFLNWDSVIQLGFELQVQHSSICWLICSDIALLCAKQVSLRLSFVKPKQCLRYSRCATKQRAAAYQWLVFGWGSCKTSCGSNSTM